MSLSIFGGKNEQNATIELFGTENEIGVLNFFVNEPFSGHILKTSSRMSYEFSLCFRFHLFCFGNQKIVFILTSKENVIDSKHFLKLFSSDFLEYSIKQLKI